ncbi:hypothetical protein [Haloarcula litorea]|uniref:hypothetical protein n=1 Tax=Haloarcula litorea TaxID=3032579 RepID=UPI0023E79023|nr:hypothetical protein [Halomicroarcula sp. GDY20]
MPSVVADTLFSEPSGRPNSLAQFASALAFTGIYVWSASNGSPQPWLLVMVFGATLAGVAESLPKARRRTAGVLRLVALLSLCCLVAAIVLVPELVVW